MTAVVSAGASLLSTPVQLGPNLELYGHKPSNPLMGGVLRLSAALVTFYGSRLSNPSKDRLAPCKTSTRTFCWPWAAFASLDRFYTDASSTIYLRRVLCRFWLQNTCTNVYYSSMAQWNCSEKYRASCADSASRELRPEIGREESIYRPRIK